MRSTSTAEEAARLLAGRRSQRRCARSGSPPCVVSYRSLPSLIWLQRSSTPLSPSSAFPPAISCRRPLESWRRQRIRRGRRRPPPRTFACEL